MPELPEVEVCRRGLAPELVGARIEGVKIRAPKLRQDIPRELLEVLPGCQIVAVRRRAKYLLIDCQREGVQGSLFIHLGMSSRSRSMTILNWCWLNIYCALLTRVALGLCFGNRGHRRLLNCILCSHRRGLSRYQRLSRSTGFLRLFRKEVGQSSRP